MEKLAKDGGKKFREKSFPGRTLFGEEEVKLATEAIRSQNLFCWSGTKVQEFEEKFAGLYGVKHAVASTSGTASIHVAVCAVNPSPGDEIITAPITDLGTIVPILQQNAIPVFADIDETYNMDPEDVERNITERTKAIIVVHLFGNPCDMDAMSEIARRHNLILIEDCSQAHVTKYKGRYCGTIGDIGCFSLQQSKHMTTGDGGVTITNDEELFERMRLFRDKGYRRKGWGPRAYLFLAPCYRMNELTAAVGLGQIPKVRARVEKRTALGNKLTELLKDVDGIKPAPRTPGAEHSYWMYALRVEKWPAGDFAEALRAEGVPAGHGYIGKPIFMCAEALRSKITYGDSQCPFSCPHAARKIEYDESLCPRTQEALDHMVTFAFNENYSESDIADVAGAIGKVASLL